MFRKNNNKRIINEIISTASTAVIMLTAADGNTIGFYSELNNFYKRSYWMNPNCDDFYSFAITFARKVFADDPEEYKKIIQFKHCAYGFNKDSIIIKEALKRISEVNGDCLLVLDNFEELRGRFGFNVIEFILQNSPKNLKILLVSRDFLNINYNVFTEQCPKLIELPEEDYFPEQDVLDDLTEEEKSLYCFLAPLRFIYKDFVSTLGEDAVKNFDNIAKKRPDCVLKRGADCYRLNEKVFDNPYTEEFSKIAAESVIEAKKLYYKFLRDTERDPEAFMFALLCEDKKMISDTVISIIDKGEYMFELCNFVNANIESLEILFDSEWDETYPGLEFMACLQLYYSGNYDDGKVLFEKIIASAEYNSKLEIDSRYMVLKILAKQKKYRRILGMIKSLINERMSENADINHFEMIVCRIPDMLKAGEIPASKENSRLVEELMLKDEFKDKYWYPKALQVAAELNFDWGNYGKATEYIKQLQEIIPFYTIPYKLMNFYYYMGDMPLAVAMAKKALTEELNNNIETDLADVYTLLAKTSVYFNKYTEGLEYIDNAIKSAPSRESIRYAAISLRAIICAKMGRKDYAKDYAMIYAKYAEINSPVNAYYLYGAVAYCAFRQNDFDTANVYANKCIKEASTRSGMWLIAVAVALNILLTKDETTNVNGLMEKLFKTCRAYGMHAIVLDYYECFEKLFKYAKNEDIAVDYVCEMEEKYKQKLLQISANGELCVKLMGTTSVTVAGKELNWKTKKAKELFLMYVWNKGEGMDRNFILSTLWPDYVYVSAINNLKTTNNIIRNTLSAANVIHKLEYANGKYTMTLDNIQCDYLDFKEKLASYDETVSLKERVELSKDLLNSLNGDFAAEVTLPLFRTYGDHMKEKLMLDVIKLISELIDNGDVIEARRMITYTSKADTQKQYEKMLAEQENRVSEFFERK